MVHKPYAEFLKSAVLDSGGMTQSRFEQSLATERDKKYRPCSHFNTKAMDTKWHVNSELTAAGRGTHREGLSIGYSG